MKVFKVTTLVLVLIMAMIVPVFAESESVEAAEDRTLMYDEGEEGEGVEGGSGEDRDPLDYSDRTELQINTDLFVFSREIQEQLAAKNIKIIYTSAVNEEKVELGVYPDEAATREEVLNLLVQNNIGEEENFKIVHSEEVSTMPISTDDPPDAYEDQDTPVSDEEREARAGDSEGNENDMDEEDYVRPDDENAEMGITSVDDLEGDGEESNNGYVIPIVTVLGLAAIGGGVFYFKR